MKRYYFIANLVVLALLVMGVSCDAGEGKGSYCDLLVKTGESIKVQNEKFEVVSKNISSQPQIGSKGTTVSISIKYVPNDCKALSELLLNFNIPFEKELQGSYPFSTDFLPVAGTATGAVNVSNYDTSSNDSFRLKSGTITMAHKGKNKYTIVIAAKNSREEAFDFEGELQL